MTEQEITGTTKLLLIPETIITKILLITEQTNLPRTGNCPTNNNNRRKRYNNMSFVDVILYI